MAAERRQRRRRRLLGLLALGCIALQFAGRLDASAVALGLWLSALALADRVALRRLWMPRFWLITLAFALSSGLLLGPRDTSLLGLAVSTQGLAAGSLMVIRGGFLFALASWASRALAGAGLERWARRLGAGELVSAAGSALRLLPELTERLQLARSEAAGRQGGGRLRLAYGAAVELVAGCADLAENMAAGDSGPALVVLVGSPDSGKTARLTGLVQQLRAAGLRVGGICQPKRMQPGSRPDYDLEDLSDGRRRAFAHWRGLAGPDRPGYAFSEAGWRWAAERLGRAAGRDQVVMVDEVGLLEAQRQGHWPAIEAGLRDGRADVWVLAVREKCLPAIRSLVGPPDQTLAVDEDPAVFDRLLRWINDRVLARRSVRER
jgi:nucleoside-triphosphatase THEP1